MSGDADEYGQVFGSSIAGEDGESNGFIHVYSSVDADSQAPGREEGSVSAQIADVARMADDSVYQLNASSGMGVADDSIKTFMELKRKKVHRYVIFKVDEKMNEVIVEKTGGPTESYDDFASALPENDCRYAIYDFDFVTSENCQKSKIFFIAWSPDVSRIRSKMLYATSKERFIRELDGIHYEIQATDPT